MTRQDRDLAIADNLASLIRSGAVDHEHRGEG
jgi:hypothetical protein